MDTDLHPDEAAWLDRHLGECRPCRIAAAEYVSLRGELRALRERSTEPPRDLWARTAAAIERESAAGSSSRRRRKAGVPLGAMSGVLVIAVVVGATLLADPPPGPITADPAGSGSPAPTTVAVESPASPRPTPILVGAGDVGFVRAGEAGGWGYTVARIDRVCPATGRPDCAPIDDGIASRPVLLPADPKSVIGSPSRGQAVVVGATREDGNSVFVVALPAEATPQPTEPPPSETPPPSTGPVDPLTPSPDPTPSPSPEPTVAVALAIVSDVTVVGESAAYSPDGTWFAFSARPADGSTGPDIYLWRVGDERARPVTTDHNSVFASWLGDRLLGSRPDPGPDPVDGSALPSTFLLDPETGEETPVADAGWRPVVDPTGRLVVTWSGTLGVSEDGLTWGPGDGALIIRSRPLTAAEVGAEDQVIAASPLTEFDARWDETGSWLAVWIADPVDPAIGRLSLFHVDPDSGLVDRPANAPNEVTALAGFSIGDGRLAWATPSGQGGEGSRVRIVAWTDDGVGGAESVPGEDVIVVR
jgi:hypothetical protein